MQIGGKSFGTHRRGIGAQQRGDEGCVYGIDNSVQSIGRAVAPLLGAACAVWFSLRGAFLATSVIFAAVAIMASLTLCRSAAPETR